MERQSPRISTAPDVKTSEEKDTLNTFGNRSLQISLVKMRSCWKYIIRMFTAVALLVTVQTETAQAAINRTDSLWYIHTMENFTTMRVNELLVHSTWMNLTR